MRNWHKRFARAILDDSTRNLQIVSVLASFGVAHWLLTEPVPQFPLTARAVFYFIDDKVLAGVLLGSGLIQLTALGGPRWQLRAWAAWLQWMIWLYCALCYTLTNQAALVVPFLYLFTLIEMWVVIRTFHDREINGADRRGGYL